MKKPKSILSNLPTCNISFDFDHCLPFILFPQPPLGLANHGCDVGARLDTARREGEREKWRERARPREVLWMAILSLTRKGAFHWQLCVVCLSIQDKPQTQHSIWQTRGQKKKRERTKFAPFFKKWTQGSQAVFHSSWSFSFLNKPPGF